jgi:putative photosynthetic complex assembly protein
MASSSHQRFPRFALIAVAGVISLTLLAVIYTRVSGMDISYVPTTATVVDTRELRFTDHADGSVMVHTVPDEQLVAVLEPGTNSFIRGVLRSLNRERRFQDVNIYEPYRLVRWDDGRLSLEDPATDQQIDIGAFGRTQVDAFAALLMASGESAP